MKRREKHGKTGREKLRADSLITALLVLLLSFTAIATGLILPELASGIQSRKIEKTYKTEALEPDILHFESDTEIYESPAEAPSELQSPD